MTDRVMAMDVERQEFSHGRRGYDQEEVRLYLRSVAEEIQRLNLEVGRLLEENGRLKIDCEELRKREGALQHTLVAAQNFTEELKERARREGELVVQEARLRADQILHQTQEQLVAIEADITRAKVGRETFESRLRSLIEQHLTLIDLRRDTEDSLAHLRAVTRRTGAEASG